MSKTTIIFLVVIIIAVIVIAWATVSRPAVFKIPFGPQGPGIAGQKEVIVGCGWSVKPNVKEAVQEAVVAALKEFKDEPPEYAILFSTVKYDSEELSKELRRLLPNTKVQGGTVMYGKKPLLRLAKQPFFLLPRL